MRVPNEVPAYAEYIGLQTITSTTRQSRSGGLP